MARTNKRASIANVNAVHRLVGKELVRQLRAAARSKEPMSAALLTAGISYLKLTGATDPAPSTAPKADRLASSLPSREEMEKGLY